MEANTNITLWFRFHEIRVAITTDDAAVAEFIGSDFSQFRIPDDRVESPSQIHILVSYSNPPLDRIPDKSPSPFRTKDATIHESKGQRFLNSDGSILVIQDFANERAEIYSLNRDLLCEKAYLMIMSRVGDWLDRKGLHRIHAMGLAFDGRAVLCLLPMGGGKTTLALGVLRNKKFSLLSEEIPIVFRDGRLFPFPIRIGVCEGTPLSVPDRYVRRFVRSRYDPKILIDARFFKDQIAGIVHPGILFVGKRVDAAEPEIVPLSFVKGFSAMWNMCVIGRGVPQLLEYVLRPNLRDGIRRLSIVLSRIRASWALLRRSERYELRLCDDTDANANAVVDFVAGRIASRENTTS